MDIVALVEQYGFPTLASVAMGYFIFFVYNFMTKEIKPKLGEASTVLIALIDRIRMLDNDIIRLKAKINTVIELKELQDKKVEKKDEKPK